MTAKIIPQRPGMQPGQTDHFARMCDARTAMIDAYFAWLKCSHPSRDSADEEVESTMSVLRQLTILHTKGGTT